MKIQNLADLYLDQLQDMYSCERQMIMAIPQMLKAASDPQLKDALASHREQSKGHLERIDRILRDLRKGPGRKICEAVIGMFEESTALVDADADPGTRDAGVTCAAQKIEHYQIAAYASLRTFASTLGRPADMVLLEASLMEEENAGRSLTVLAAAASQAAAQAGTRKVQSVVPMIDTEIPAYAKYVAEARRTI